MGFNCELVPAGIFTYRESVGQGLIEHEVDHLFVGVFDGTPAPNPHEVREWNYTSTETLARDLLETPDKYAAWLPIAFGHVRLHLPRGAST